MDATEVEVIECRGCEKELPGPYDECDDCAHESHLRSHPDMGRFEW